MKPVLTGILILALFAADAWALMTHEGHAADLHTYSVIHDTYRAPWLDRAMKLGTELGETKTGLFGLVFFGFFGPPTAQVTAKLAAVSLGGASLITLGAKWFVNRARPEGTSTRDNSSFPSAHAVGAAAVAVLVSKRHGRLGIFAWAVALWIGLSRIYLGRHYPTDVLSGYLLGTIASWLVLRGERWFEKLHF
jgi:undecaprenyl-diphosphatase